MNDMRFKNLYDAMTSHIDYSNMIESYGDDYVTFSNTNFELLQVIFGGFYLTSIMDEYFKKQIDGSMKSILVPEFVKILVSRIAKYNGKGYTLGNLSYKDEYTVIEKVRNKLAHGDFIVQNGEIIFEEKNVQGKIKVKDFVSFIATLEHNSEDYKMYDSRTKILHMCCDYSKLIQITNAKEFDYVCDNLYTVEITECPIFPKTRNAKTCDLIKSIYENFSNMSGKMTIQQAEALISGVKCEFEKMGLNVKYTIKKINELPEYDKVKQKFLNNIEYYSKLPIGSQVKTISNFAYRINQGQYQKFDMQMGLLINEVLLDSFNKNPNYTLTEIVDDNPYLSSLFLYHFDDAILSTYLVGFNSLYEYGLEKGLTIQGSYNWISIFEGKSLDFSKLEVDFMDDPKMLIEHTFNNYTTDIANYESKNVAKVDALISKCESILENYRLNCKTLDKKKEEQLEQNVINAKNEKMQLLDKINELKKHYVHFDLAKYTRNINIIIHIRNAIAHGNVFVDSYSNNIEETEVIFKDYLDGTLVYEKKIKIKEFIDFFTTNNLSVIYDFIVNNIQNPKLINDDFIEELNERMKIRNKVLEKK